MCVVVLFLFGRSAFVSACRWAAGGGQYVKESEGPINLGKYRTNKTQQGGLPLVGPVGAARAARAAGHATNLSQSMYGLMDDKIPPTER